MLLDWDDIWYTEVFGVADYESERRIQKFKMVDAIWRTEIQIVTKQNASILKFSKDIKS